MFLLVPLRGTHGIAGFAFFFRGGIANKKAYRIADVQEVTETCRSMGFDYDYQRLYADRPQNDTRFLNSCYFSHFSACAPVFFAMRERARA